MFSSTASLYGNNCIDKPATEDTLLDPVNPYAETKLMGERMIYWMANRYDWKYVIFRYFNVAGAEMDASNGLRVKIQLTSFQILTRPHWDKMIA